MGVDPERESSRDAVDGGFERVVGELLDAAAGVAHDVVMMLAARLRRLVAGGAVPHLQSADEAEPDEELQSAVDARDPDRLVGRTQVVGERRRGDAARTLGERLDDPEPRRSRAVTRAPEHLLGVVAPGGGGRDGHRLDDSAVSFSRSGRGRTRSTAQSDVVRETL